MIATKGKFRIDNSDGTYTEVDFAMPHDVAEKILIAIITWEEEWVATTKTHLEYQKISKEFLEKAGKEPPKSDV
jgi:hypothetical protein